MNENKKIDRFKENVSVAGFLSIVFFVGILLIDLGEVYFLNSSNGFINYFIKDLSNFNLLSYIGFYFITFLILYFVCIIVIFIVSFIFDLIEIINFYKNNEDKLKKLVNKK